jgi:osmotically-inducible protein OsmY
MNNQKSFLFGVTGLALGAGLMYLLDPAGGRRRRALLTDRVASGATGAGNAVAASSRDMAHRTRGLVSETLGRFSDETVSDDTLIQRVRASLGHHTHNASAIDVEAANGCVTLTGTVAPDDVQGVVDATRGVRGVADVRNRMVIQEPVLADTVTVVPAAKPDATTH